MRISDWSSDVCSSDLLARAATIFATLSLSKAPRERAMAVSTAKVTVAEACRFVGQNAVQLHGGMGMPDELPLGSYFQRATVTEREFGAAGTHQIGNAPSRGGG